jgi:hypothetical protein
VKTVVCCLMPHWHVCFWAPNYWLLGPLYLGAQLLVFGPAVGALVDFFPLGRAVYCRMPILLTTWTEGPTLANCSRELAYQLGRDDEGFLHKDILKCIYDRTTFTNDSRISLHNDVWWINLIVTISCDGLKLLVASLALFYIILLNYD